MSYKEKYQELKGIADKKPSGAVEELVLMLHAVNTVNGLKCIVDETECVLPENWLAHKEGVYTFIYKRPSEKRAQFRFVDNGDGNLSVNFVLEGSETLHQVALKVNDGINANAEKYQAYLKSALSGNKAEQSTEPSYRPRNIEPVPLGDFRPGYQPVRPPVLGGPVSSDPFPGGGLFNPNAQYVGPDSQVFRGAYRPHGIGGQDNPNPLRIPPGARYDPTSPFDTRGLGTNPDRNDFFGFDEFGRPRKPPGFGGGQNPPGFGGGFGGRGFGGSGPGFF